MFFFSCRNSKNHFQPRQRVKVFWLLAISTIDCSSQSFRNRLRWRNRKARRRAWRKIVLFFPLLDKRFIQQLLNTQTTSGAVCWLCASRFAVWHMSFADSNDKTSWEISERESFAFIARRKVHSVFEIMCLCLWSLRLYFLTFYARFNNIIYQALAAMFETTSARLLFLFSGK